MLHFWFFESYWLKPGLKFFFRYFHHCRIIFVKYEPIENFGLNRFLFAGFYCSLFHKRKKHCHCLKHFRVASDILSLTQNLVPFRPWKILVNLFKINTSVCTFIKLASMTTDLITANELIWEGKPWHLSTLFQPKNGSKGTREKDSFYSSKGNYSLTIRCLEK